MAKLSLEENRKTRLLINQMKNLEKRISEILNNSNTEEENRYTSYRYFAQIYNSLENQVKSVLKTDELFSNFKIEKLGSPSSTIWTYQKSIMEETLVNTGMLITALETNFDYIDDEFDNLENFFISKLRSVIFNKPQKEKEVQDAIESLLVGRGFNKGIEYCRESGRFSFSAKEYIPDFVVPKLNLCIEVKLLREGRRSKIIDEICADITAYSTKYERQLFIVYDLGTIQNELEFKRDIESFENTKIVIIKH